MAGDRTIQLFNTLLIGVTGASAVIEATCVSGVSSATCYAFADTYIQAMVAFAAVISAAGLAYVWNFACAGVLDFLAAHPPRPRAVALLANLVVTCLCLGALMFVIFGTVGSAVQGVRNLRLAATYCLTTKGSGDDAFRREPIPLYREFFSNSRS